MVLERAAKLILRGGENGVVDVFSINEFTGQVLRDVALDQITDKTFEHLKMAALIHNLPMSDIIEIHEAKLACTSFSKDTTAWTDYYGFLKGAGMHLEAKRAFERAMAVCVDKQAILTNCS